MPEPWVEVNVQHSANLAWEDSLLDFLPSLVDSLKNQSLIVSWHYLREDDKWRGINQASVPRTRIRFRASNTGHLSQIRGIIDPALTQARQKSLVTDFYYGNHGAPGQDYQGEASGFDENGPNPKGWEVTQKWFEAGSELALILLQVRRGRITIQPNARLHFNDEIHFFCNQLGKPEGVANHPSLGQVHCTPTGD